MSCPRLLALAVALVGLAAGRPPNVPFVVHQIDDGASETASVFDVNGDGRLDIVSGDFWYPVSYTHLTLPTILRV